MKQNVIKGTQGKCIIKVYNKGKSKARNVTVTFDDEELSSSVMNNPSPIDIKPQNAIQMSYFAHSQSPDTTKISFTWEDDFSKENIDTQTIQL